MYKDNSNLSLLLFNKHAKVKLNQKRLKMQHDYIRVTKEMLIKEKISRKSLNCV